MTHHFAMTLSSRIKFLKIDKFGDFSCDIDYNSRTDVFRDVISLIANQCDPRRPKEPPAYTKCPPAAQSNKRSALDLTIKTRLMFIYVAVRMRFQSKRVSTVNRISWIIFNFSVLI